MMNAMRGTGASAGVAIGPTHLVQRVAIEVKDSADPKGDFAEAVKGVVADLQQRASEATDAGLDEAAGVLSAQAMMADDLMLAEAVKEHLDAGTGLGDAVRAAATSLSDMLASLDDEYLAARSADVLEAGDHILRRLAGVEGHELSALADPCIIVAQTLTAAETSVLDPDVVLGFVTAEGGATSHVAVIARSLGIPAVVGLAGITESVGDRPMLAIDGSSGEVVIAPDASTVEQFQERIARETAARAEADRFSGVAVDFDGRPMTIAANVGDLDDVERAKKARSDGVGLFRTEVLFLDRSTPPTEDEQVTAYRTALESFDHPVVVRTFDIGGDKPAPYLDMPDEENPFLGVRGVRVYGHHDDLYRSQIRALLRAGVAGDLWVMIPMVATIGDYVEARRVIDEEAASLESSGVAHRVPKVGVMVEVPSAALIADQLARHVDFFSIGTNDLTQYTMAADRMSGVLAGYADAAHPAVLELCRRTAEAGATAGISVSVCGEAGSDPVLSVLFAAMGIDKLSVAPPLVNGVKARIAGADPDHARRLLDQALRQPDAASVRAVVEGTSSS